MAQVRETIELLTKVLSDNGLSKIKAESFRLAKFDKDETALQFWKLLFELLYFCKYSTIDDVTVKAYSELSTEELVVYVKQEMQDKGFLSPEFAALQNDGSTGSRELLLAFGWLMCKENMMDRFMNECASPLAIDPLSTVEMDREDKQKPSNYLSQSQSLTPAQKIQHLQLLNGKLRGNLRRLYALQRERSKLQHRIHESTEGVSFFPDRNHLSDMEAHMLRHPELLKKILKLLEKDNERLQHMLQWKEQETVFWKWMESILDLKLKEMRQTDIRMTFYNIPPDSVSKMETARKRLEQSILKYESVIEHLEDMWETKRNDITQTELENLLTSIDLEISMHRNNLNLDSTENMSQKVREPCLKYVKNSAAAKKLSNIHASSLGGQGHLSNTHGNGHNLEVDIKSEISKLEEQLQRLELESEFKRQKYRIEIDNLAANIPNAICIQPTLYQ